MVSDLLRKGRAKASVWALRVADWFVELESQHCIVVDPLVLLVF